MVLTVLVLGFIAALLLGKRAGWFVPFAAVAWAIGLSEAGACVGDCLPGAALVGAINAAVGVAVGLAVRWPVRAIAK